MHYKPTTTSWIEISQSALKNNIQFIQSILPKLCIFSSVVKGNAYGHDIDIYAPLAYANGIRHFSVYSAQEAYRLKKVIPSDATILCMGNLTIEEMQWANEQNIEYYINSFKALNNAIEAAKKSNRKAIIHLELETGMNRTGVDLKDYQNIWTLLEANDSWLMVKGICTHLAGAESITNYKRITEQIKRFRKIKKMNINLNIDIPQYHLACSAVAIRYPNQTYDLARIGIMQYGFFPNNETYMHYLLQNPGIENPLKRVMSWKSKIVDIKLVKAGEFIGYGSSYYTNIETKIAIIPVGYAYGYARSLSNHGRILINGHRVEVIGTINMNMLTADISSIPEVNIGDEVVLIGKQDGLEISVSSFSEFSNQLNYELLARLPMDIERKIVD